ncbi:N-acetylmuramoyl-L-alanine amidase [Geomicrobium halophilum]|uniref:N-acetylmuramoyl-L-alanine amidase n=1 Tax=Geomicrobium halophilum TaxID=549000 RepID=A0A841PZI8_9BACL|nr:SH3 domain-containing protein [Geomicrobium halophilum]MBB6450383.1 N-acetylmuramoyl-L-alanine amidase [Geomicrobium halophilum]
MNKEVFIGVRQKMLALFLMMVVVFATSWGNLNDGVVGEASIVEAEEVGDVPFAGTVTASIALNVRTGPANTYDRIGQLPPKEVVEVIEVHGNWYEIDYASEIGYVHRSYIEEHPTNNPEQPENELPSDNQEVIATGVVEHPQLIVRKEAGGSAPSLGFLDNGDSIDIYSYVDGGPWVQIEYEGNVAYTHSDYLTVTALDEEEPADNQEVIATGVVEHPQLIVREEAGGSAPSLGFLDNGDSVDIYSYVDGGPWVQIEYEGNVAYTHSGYLTVTALDEEEPADNQEVIATGVVEHPQLIVREEAGGSAPSLGFLDNGDSIDIYSYVDGGPWVQVEYEGNVAYTHSDYLTVVTDALFEGTVTASIALNVRAGPANTYDRIGQLPSQEIVEVIEVHGDWYEIDYSSEIGYVHSSYIEEHHTHDPNQPEDEAEENQEVIATGVVEHPQLIVREGPSNTEEGIGFLSKGDHIEIYNYADGSSWVQIIYNGDIAYTHMNYLDITEKGDVIETANVTASSLNVRTGPGASYDSIGTLPSGTLVEIIEFQNGSPWVQIAYDGGYAYTHSGYLRVTGSGKLAGQTIVVDAGHGGHDPGAQGNGLIEKNLVLDVSREFASRLEEAGANVIMTRDGDYFVTLGDRSRIANNANADLFISVHANAFSPSAHGAETFYNNTYSGRQSQQIATDLQNRIVQDTGMRDRRVDPANFAVIRNATMPSTLVELGFLTNASDAAIMRQSNYPGRAGEALYQGVLDYYNR